MSDTGPLFEGSDYYMEGPYMVFTAEFLRRRGYCCEAGCRHCPWGFDPNKRTDGPASSTDPDNDRHED